MKRCLFNRRVKKGYTVKDRYFIAIDSSGVKTIADTHIYAADELKGCTDVDDLERH